MDEADRLNEGERACRFIENLSLVGDFSGKPFVLRPWQRDFVHRLFGTLDRNGRRQYRKCFLALPRKQAKTCLCAAIVLYCLLGDGKHGQEIYSCAATRDQASIIFRYASQMVRHDPYLSKICTIHEYTKRIVVERTNNVYQALSQDAHSSHGRSPAVVIYDELHAAPNRELWDVMNSGMGARSEPLTIAITTAGFDRTSFCFQEWEYALKVRDGVINDPTYLPVLYAADPDDVTTWDSEVVWHKAMPALGDYCELEFIRNEAAKAKEMPTELNKFLRLYLNIWTQAESRWIARDKWDQCGEPFDAESLIGTTCYAGLDLSSTTDLSALVLAFPQLDGVLKVLCHFWIPEESAHLRERRDRVPYLTWARQGHLEMTPGDVIDYEFIRTKINELAKMYNIKSVACDPYNATYLATQLQGDGIPIEYFRQGFVSMNEPTKELGRLIIGGKLRHNSNPILTWMSDNCVADQDAAGNLKLSKSKSREKIDGLVATVMALGMSMTTPQPFAGSGAIVWF